MKTKYVCICNKIFNTEAECALHELTCGSRTPLSTEERLDDLEKRIKELEARPAEIKITYPPPVQPPYYVPYPTYPDPTTRPWDPPWTITCQNDLYDTFS